MASPKRDELLSTWRQEESGQPQGWDFSALEGRMTESDPPWDYEAHLRQRLREATTVLDMGTGGGEFLLRFVDDIPADTTATEGWEPNVAVARANLADHGVEVVTFGQPDDSAEPSPMPFADGRFDLVCNRHESYHPDELFRVLRPGGYFLTQQVDGTEFSEVRQVLNHPSGAPHATYRNHRKQLLGAGFEVLDGAEFTGYYEFNDVAALIAYLQLVPWDVPEDFSVDAYADALLTLHEQGHARGGTVRASKIRYWLLARKPR